MHCFPLLILVVMAMLAAGCAAPPRAESLRRQPDVILIMTDDLGVGELGCYGQAIIRTPFIDALAGQGMRFSSAYSGSCVCAPSRCTLLTGLHTGHAAIRDNRELTPTGQQPLPANTITIATLLRDNGYATAAIGKWGLGPPGSSGDPSRHGFGLFFGYLCQRHAHNHCPSFLYRNDQVVALPENKDKWPDGIVGGAYAPDLFRDEALAFVRSHRDRPFFLLYATPVPHVALQAPEDSLAEYRGAFEDAPYDGKAGYLKHPTPRAAYAAMVTRMDRDVGAILAELKRLGLDDDTLVIFTSDNGPAFNGGTDSGFFASTGGLRGLKGELYEGGIHVPLIARWPGRIPTGRVEQTVTANWDLFPTLASVCGVPADRMPTALDGVNLWPVLSRTGPAPTRTHLYWEYHAGGGWQGARIGNWKGIRRNAKGNADGPIELYDLATDPHESINVATAHPDVVSQIARIMASRTPSSVSEWNFAKPAPPRPAGTP
ncbi:MAG: arylsulfatase [Phycisphaerales bacterium]